MASKCLTCGEATMTERTGTFHFDPPPNIPGGTIKIKNAAWRECSACGEAIIADALDKALDAEARRRRGLLSPDEIKAVRERTGLSQEAMAEMLGVGGKTYTRWETGKSIQNKANDNLIRLLDRHAERFLLIDAERRPERQREVADYVASLQELKGGNRVGMAAHGGDLPSSVAEPLLRMLRRLAEQRKEDAS